MHTRKLTNEEASALLASVAEEWKAFWFSHGAVAKNLEELAAVLGAMTEEQFVHHVNPGKNDLACWVDEVIGDATLAAKLRLLRTQAATHTMTTRRVSELRAALTPAPAAEAAPAAVETAPASAAESATSSPVTVTAAVTLTAPKKRVVKAKKAVPAAKAKKAETKGSVWSRLLKG